MSDARVGKPTMYLPKRSTVLILCFVITTFAAAQFYALDGAMMQLLKDDDAGAYLKTEQWQVESAVYVGLAASPPAFGWFLVASGRAKLVLTAGLLVSSAATLATPSRFLLGLQEANLARGILGVGQGMILVGLYSAISRWIPRQEYTRAVTFVASGTYAGMLVADLASSVLVSSDGWTGFFYWLGLTPLPFLCLFAYVFKDSPMQHTTITQAELTYIRANAILADKQTVSVVALLRCKEVWAAGVTWALFFCGCQTIYHVIPYFFMEVVWSDVSFAALIILLVASNITSMVLDFVIIKDRGALSGHDHNLRKTLGAGGMLGCAVLMRAFCTAGHATTVRILAFALGLVALVFGFAGAPAGVLDVAPRQAPLIVGAAALPAAVLSVACTVGMRWVLDSTGSWQFVLSFNGVLLCIGAMVWGVWGTSDRCY
mmetsp:Transcript_8054/g.33888  ORF Transcript_8054/g.33888 Transcript_8054/m.33888 type:complete len:430 (+) Transcript_8054:83-1372(+)|eukprot:CAMPEP_0114625484 /NCGR_PEP_ID=MMETSP0168-20121206/11294_1 /TAXON_ID=95228 ORGANISM="Vannella sp., Strain DIVA3 517/6/12" /NCGR_SAMPLE_ID=MMETSP0168 /ASSEMBLY_ACC=CAM_ASM_000044 /LENGTH=429 /DNA_ID=CAMNT_0001836767 /DNA_START=27 /DNA_END=1316 /DNA_ORIENTATION=-